jgi:hypothetical protein
VRDEFYWWISLVEFDNLIAFAPLNINKLVKEAQ